MKFNFTHWTQHWNTQSMTLLVNIYFSAPTLPVSILNEKLSIWSRLVWMKNRSYTSCLAALCAYYSPALVYWPGRPTSCDVAPLPLCCWNHGYMIPWFPTLSESNGWRWLTGHYVHCKTCQSESKSCRLLLCWWQEWNHFNVKKHTWFCVLVV